MTLSIATLGIMPIQHYICVSRALLCIVMLSVIILSVVILSIIILSRYSQCCCSGCHFAECCCSDCHFAQCGYSGCCNSECRCSESCRFAQYTSSVSRNSNCHCAERFGATSRSHFWKFVYLISTWIVRRTFNLNFFFAAKAVKMATVVNKS